MSLTERVMLELARAELDGLRAQAEAAVYAVLADMKAMNGVMGWLRPCHMLEEYERLVTRMSIVVDNSPGE